MAPGNRARFKLWRCAYGWSAVVDAGENQTAWGWEAEGKAPWDAARGAVYHANNGPWGYVVGRKGWAAIMRCVRRADAGDDSPQAVWIAVEEV